MSNKRMRSTLCALLLALGTQATCGQGTATPFAPVVNFTGTYTPADPSLLVDFDLDGYPDQIVFGFGQVLIAFGLPGGGVQPVAQAVIGSFSTSNVIAVFLIEDMNFDGYPDIITGELALTGGVDLKIHHNNGSRGVQSFVPLVLDPSVANYRLQRLTSVQFAASGVPQIMVLSGNQNANPVLSRYWLSVVSYDTSSSAWVPRSIGQLPVNAPALHVRPSPYGLSYPEDSGPQGDFNGDGILDWLLTAFVAQPANPNAQLVFSHWVMIPGLSQWPWFDLQNPIEVRIPRPAVPTGVTLFSSQRSEISDVNGDGVDDLVTLFFEGFTQTTVPLVFPLTTNAWGLFVSFGGALTPLGASWVTTPWGVNASTENFPFRDYDGDGLLDIVSLEGQPATSPFEHRLLFARGYRDGSFSPFMVQEVPRGMVFAAGFAADLDGDGDLDILDNSTPFNPPRPATAFYNESIMGLGYPAVSGVTPRIRRSSARLGDPTFGVAVELAPRLSPTVLAVSLGPATSTTPSPIGVDLDQLLWPLGAIGPTTTDFRGVAIQPLPLPPDPRLAGATLYFQWAVASPNALGFCATPTAKIILWP